MSFPTIPDINPEITINREDALNLLLTSIALEEVSLSDLIDAEVKKICHVVNEQDDRHTTEDIKEISRSVNQTVKDIIKLQMLLQFKLENVQEMICPCKTSASTSATSTTSTTTTTTTTATTTKKVITTTKSTSTTTTKPCTATKTTATKSTTSTSTATTAGKQWEYCLKGKTYGCVTNECDFFLGGIATINANVCKSCKSLCCTEENLLQYHIRKDTVTEGFRALPGSLETICLKTDISSEIKIKGKCSIVRKTCSRQDITDTGNFECIVRDSFWTKKFRMVFLADNKPDLNHDSGMVAVPVSGLSIEV